MALRIGFAGCGWVTATVWLPLATEHPAFLPVVMMDVDPARLRGLGDAWPGLGRAATLDELLDHGPDVVVVAVPNALHAPLAAALLSRGIGVLVEKPACLTMAELDAMVQAGGQGDGALAVSAATRLRADVARVARLVADGAVGPPRLIEAEWVRASGIPGRGSWFTRRALAGGGVGMDLGWHMLDVGLSLVGYPRPTRAAVTLGDHWMRGTGADAAWRGDDPAAALPADVEDTVVALFETDAGVGLKLHVAWASHQAVDTTRLAVHGPDGVLELTTTFGFSTSRVRAPSLTLLRRGGTEALDLPAVDPRDGYRAQLSELARLMAAGERPALPAGARSVVAGLEMLYASRP